MDYSAIANLATMFFEQADSAGDRPFLWHRLESGWVSQDYSQAAETVVAMARGLAALGVEQGDRVAIVSENRPEWVLADLAICAMGAVAVPTYTTYTVDDHRHILEHSGARAVFVSNRQLAERVIPAAAAATDCETVIVMDQPVPDMPGGLRGLHWDDLLAAASGRSDDIRAIAGSLAKDDLACFIYTSGTGGRPKGAMLTHGSMLANCRGAHDLLVEAGLGDEVFLSLLPLSHSYEHTCGLFFPISIGAQIYFAEGPDRVAQNLQEARPTIMMAVPRLYEVLHGRILRGINQAGGLRRQMFFKAIELGRKRREAPAEMGTLDRLLDSLLDRLVRKKVAQRLGGRLKAFVSGGAALNPDVGHFFLGLGVNILQGYGQTEASPVISCNRMGRIRIDTVGPPLAGVEVRIADDGEILVRGDLLMKGYWQDPETTAETIVDGWLHTGDVGRLDADGYLSITDRKKDIIVNSGGDNISPARVEGALTLEPEIDQAMVLGDRRPYLVAIVVPAEEFVAEWSQDADRAGNLADLADDEAFRKVIGEAVARVNQRLSRIEQVRHFIVAPAPFNTDNAMMTPTLKVRRHVVMENYGARLEALYGRG